MSLQSTRLPALAVQVAFFATVLTCVYGLSRLSPLMPSPTQLALALSELLQGGELYTHIATTLTEAFVGLAIAAILGIVIGLLMGSSRNATEFLNPIVRTAARSSLNGSFRLSPVPSTCPSVRNLPTLSVGPGNTIRISAFFSLNFS